jgi:protein LTV1
VPSQIEKLYEEDSDSDDEDPSDAEYDSDGDLIAPDLVSREDFDGLLDDFLDNFEVLGNKLKPVLPGTTAAEKLATFRGAMMEDEQEGFDRDRILQEHREREAEGWDEESDDEKLPKQHIIGEGRAEWDCETIISASCAPSVRSAGASNL